MAQSASGTSLWAQNACWIQAGGGGGLGSSSHVTPDSSRELQLSTVPADSAERSKFHRWDKTPARMWRKNVFASSFSFSFPFTLDLLLQFQVCVLNLQQFLQLKLAHLLGLSCLWVPHSQKNEGIHLLFSFFLFFSVLGCDTHRPNRRIKF